MFFGEIAAFGKHAEAEGRWGMSVRAVNEVSFITVVRWRLLQRVCELSHWFMPQRTCDAMCIQTHTKFT